MRAWRTRLVLCEVCKTTSSPCCKNSDAFAWQFFAATQALDTWGLKASSMNILSWGVSPGSHWSSQVSSPGRMTSNTTPSRIWLKERTVQMYIPILDFNEAALFTMIPTSKSMYSRCRNYQSISIYSASAPAQVFIPTLEGNKESLLTVIPPMLSCIFPPSNLPKHPTLCPAVLHLE